MQPERAAEDDAAEIAALYLAAHADALGFVKRVHSDDAVRRWVRQVLLTQGETWVVRLDGRIVGFMSLDGATLDQLFVLPGFYRQGIGSLLMAKAKERSPAGLRVFAFRRNLRARLFYEAHGFRLSAEPEGCVDPQSDPDITYEWGRTCG